MPDNDCFYFFSTARAKKAAEYLYNLRDRSPTYFAWPRAVVYPLGNAAGAHRVSFFGHGGRAAFGWKGDGDQKFNMEFTPEGKVGIAYKEGNKEFLLYK